MPTTNFVVHEYLTEEAQRATGTGRPREWTPANDTRDAEHSLAVNRDGTPLEGKL
jgi:hypothetical protein